MALSNLQKYVPTNKGSVSQKFAIQVAMDSINERFDVRWEVTPVIKSLTHQQTAPEFRTYDVQPVSSQLYTAVAHKEVIPSGVDRRHI